MEDGRNIAELEDKTKELNTRIRSILIELYRRSDEKFINNIFEECGLIDWKTKFEETNSTSIVKRTLERIRACCIYDGAPYWNSASAEFQGINFHESNHNFILIFLSLH